MRNSSEVTYLIVPHPNSVVSDTKVEDMIMEWLGLRMILGCSEGLDDQFLLEFPMSGTLKTLEIIKKVTGDTELHQMREVAETISYNFLSV
jgi:hypothetical protein